MLRNPVVAIVMAIVCWSPAKAGGPATAVHIDADVYAEESTVDAPEQDGSPPGISSRDAGDDKKETDLIFDGRQPAKGSVNGSSPSTPYLGPLSQATRQPGFSNYIPDAVIQWGTQSNIYRTQATSYQFAVPLANSLQGAVFLGDQTGVINFNNMLSTAPMAVQAWYGNNLLGGDAKTAEGFALRNYLFAVSFANDARQIIKSYTTALQLPENDNQAAGVTPQQEAYMRQSIVNAQAELTIATDNMNKFTQNNSAALNLLQLLIQPTSPPPANAASPPATQPTPASQETSTDQPNSTGPTNQGTNPDDN